MSCSMTKQVQRSTGDKFKPSDFMKSRRPNLFSDTELAEQAILDRSILEYHLETLTKRKQELDFEHFARKLVVPVKQIATYRVSVERG